MLRQIVRVCAFALAAVVGVGTLYMVGAVLGSFLHPGRSVEAGDEKIPIYLVWSDIHTDIILPVDGLSVSWRSVLSDDDAPSPPPEGGYLAFGWGSESFYRDVPTMADMTPGIIATALFFDNTVVHVAPIHDPMRILPERRLTMFVSKEGLRALEQHVLATLAIGDDGKADALPGETYGYGDVFYRAHGRYNPIRTCNQWTSEGLRLAGVAAGFWTPFSQSITWVLGSDADRAAAIANP